MTTAASFGSAFVDFAEHPADELLLAWLLEETAPDVAEPVAEHLYVCNRCTDRVASLRHVVGALPQMRRLGHHPIQSRASLTELEARGARLQHIVGRHGAEVVTAVAETTDIVVMHLPVPLDPGARKRGRGTLTVTLSSPTSPPFFTLGNVVPDADEILLACHRALALSNPSLRVRVEDRPRGVVLCEALFVQPGH